MKTPPGIIWNHLDIWAAGMDWFSRYIFDDYFLLQFWFLPRKIFSLFPLKPPNKGLIHRTLMASINVVILHILRLLEFLFLNYFCQATIQAIRLLNNRR